MGFLGRPAGILGIYVALLTVKLFSIHQSSDYPAELAKVHYVGFVPVALLSFFAAKGWRPVLWIMGIYLTTHIAVVAFGIFMIRWEQYILKPFAIVMGSYFTVGGILLIRHAVQLRTSKSEQWLAPDEKTHG